MELAERASAKAANLVPTLARPRSSRSTAADFCRSKSIVFFLRTVISSVVAVHIAYKARHRKSGKWPCKSSKIWIDEQRVRAEAWNVFGLHYRTLRLVSGALIEGVSGQL